MMAGFRMPGLSSGKASDHGPDALCCTALALWVFGRLVFVHSGVGVLPGVAACSPMAWVQAIAFGCAVAAIAAKEVRADIAGQAILGLLFVASLVVFRQLADPNLAAFALLLAASWGVRPQRLLGVGVGAITAAILCVGVLRIAPSGFAGAGRQALLGLHFKDSRVIPLLSLCVLSCLFVAVRGRRPRMALCVPCVLCAAACVVRYDARRYALLLLLLVACVVADAVRHDELKALACDTRLRMCMAVAPPLLCAVVCDLASKYGLRAAGVDTGAYVSFLQIYGLLPLLLVMALYVRAALHIDFGVGLFPLWAVFAIYAVVLTCDARGMLVEMNLPLLLLSAGLGRNINEQGHRERHVEDWNHTAK